MTSTSVQLNFCKNPNCPNYGVPAQNPKRNIDGTIKQGLGNDYKFTKGRNGRLLTCKVCGTSTKLINNKAFVEESNRQKHIFSNDSICCPDKKFETSIRRSKPCRNVEVNWVDKPKRYKMRGTIKSKVPAITPKEAQRLECGACGNTFHVPLNAEYGQRKPAVEVTP